MDTKLLAKQSSELEKLEKELASVYQQRDDIQEKIGKVKSDKELPGLKKKYEGKYFRYNNGYNSTDRWWIYVHVRKVVARGHFEISRFETTTDGKSEFSTQTEYSTSIMESPITKHQYLAALKHFRERLNKLNP